MSTPVIEQSPSHDLILHEAGKWLQESGARGDGAAHDGTETAHEIEFADANWFELESTGVTKEPSLAPYTGMYSDVKATPMMPIPANAETVSVAEEAQHDGVPVQMMKSPDQELENKAEELGLLVRSALQGSSGRGDRAVLSEARVANWVPTPLSAAASDSVVMHEDAPIVPRSLWPDADSQSPGVDPKRSGVGASLQDMSRTAIPMLGTTPQTAQHDSLSKPLDASISNTEVQIEWTEVDHGVELQWGKETPKPERPAGPYWERGAGSRGLAASVDKTKESRANRQQLVDHAIATAYRSHATAGELQSAALIDDHDDRPAWRSERPLLEPSPAGNKIEQIASPSDLIGKSVAASGRSMAWEASSASDKTQPGSGQTGAQSSGFSVESEVINNTSVGDVVANLRPRTAARSKGLWQRTRTLFRCLKPPTKSKPGVASSQTAVGTDAVDGNAVASVCNVEPRRNDTSNLDGGVELSSAIGGGVVSGSDGVAALTAGPRVAAPNVAAAAVAAGSGQLFADMPLSLSDDSIIRKATATTGSGVVSIDGGRGPESTHAAPMAAMTPMAAIDQSTTPDDALSWLLELLARNDLGLEQGFAMCHGVTPEADDDRMEASLNKPVTKVELTATVSKLIGRNIPVPWWVAPASEVLLHGTPDGVSLQVWCQKLGQAKRPSVSNAAQFPLETMRPQSQQRQSQSQPQAQPHSQPQQPVAMTPLAPLPDHAYTGEPAMPTRLASLTSPLMQKQLGDEAALYRNLLVAHSDAEHNEAMNKLRNGLFGPSQPAPLLMSPLPEIHNNSPEQQNRQQQWGGSVSVRAAATPTAASPNYVLGAEPCLPKTSLKVFRMPTQTWQADQPPDVQQQKKQTQPLLRGPDSGDGLSPFSPLLESRGGLMVRTVDREWAKTDSPAPGQQQQPNGHVGAVATIFNEASLVSRNLKSTTSELAGGITSEAMDALDAALEAQGKRDDEQGRLDREAMAQRASRVIDDGVDVLEDWNEDSECARSFDSNGSWRLGGKVNPEQALGEEDAAQYPASVFGRSIGSRQTRPATGTNEVAPGKSMGNVNWDQLNPNDGADTTRKPFVPKGLGATSRMLAGEDERAGRNDGGNRHTALESRNLRSTAARSLGASGGARQSGLASLSAAASALGIPGMKVATDLDKIADLGEFGERARAARPPEAADIVEDRVPNYIWTEDQKMREKMPTLLEKVSKQSMTLAYARQKMAELEVRKAKLETANQLLSQAKAKSNQGDVDTANMLFSKANDEVTVLIEQNQASAVEEGRQERHEQYLANRLHCLMDWSQHLTDAQDYEQAMDVSDQALTVAGKAFGKGHPMYDEVDARLVLAIDMFQQQKEKGLQMMKKQSDADTAHMKTTIKMNGLTGNWDVTQKSTVTGKTRKVHNH